MVKTEFHLHFEWNGKGQESLKLSKHKKSPQIKQFDKLDIFPAFSKWYTVWKENIPGLKKVISKQVSPDMKGKAIRAPLDTAYKRSSCQLILLESHEIPPQVPPQLWAVEPTQETGKGFRFVLTLTKLSGNKPLLPLICPSHQPPSAFLMLVMISPTVIVSSSSCWAW